MGILDELKAQADKQHSQLNGFSSSKEKQEHEYRNDVLPKMQYVYTYFKKVFDYLSVIETPIQVDNYCEKFPALGVLEQQDYRLTTDKHGGIGNFEKLKDVNLFYELKGTGKLKGRNYEEVVYAKNTKLEIENERRFLTNNNIPFKLARSLKSDNDAAVIFRVERTIPVAFMFSVELEQSLIQLKIVNHENFDTSIQYLKPEEITEELLDKLASYLLRKKGKLKASQMDESSKDMIRQKLKAENDEKQRSLRIAEEEEKLRQQELEKQKIGYKLKSFFKQKLSKDNN